VLKDKVAVITGSDRGIGRGMALLFAQEGARCVDTWDRLDIPGRPAQQPAQP